MYGSVVHGDDRPYDGRREFGSTGDGLCVVGIGMVGSADVEAEAGKGKRCSARCSRRIPPRHCRAGAALLHCSAGGRLWSRAGCFGVCWCAVWTVCGEVGEGASWVLLGLFGRVGRGETVAEALHGRGHRESRGREWRRGCVGLGRCRLAGAQGDEGQQGGGA